MRETDSRNGNHGDRSFLWEPSSPEPFSEPQLGFSLIITLLSPCRCVQRSAADVADGDLARIHGGSGARFQRGAVPAVLLALQGPPGEHHGAAEKRECSFSFFICIRSTLELRSCAGFPSWQEDLCFGIPSSRVVVSSKSDTVLACTPTQSQVSFDDARHATIVPDVFQMPALCVKMCFIQQNTNCLIQRNSSFNEVCSLTNILKTHKQNRF